MAERGEFRFEIKDGNPMTFPMKRLSAYLPHLVKIFGSEDDVHLLRIDEGSAVPCIYAKDHVLTYVERRLVAIKGGTAGKEAMRAVEAVNNLLSEDSTSAVLRSPHFGVVIPFPGATRKVDPTIGPVKQDAEIQGELVQIGGRDETISIYIRTDTDEQICTASREQGRAYAALLFRKVKVFGEGKWMRDGFGRWRLLSLEISNIVPLGDDTLVDVVSRLRGLHKGDWPLPPLEFIESDIGDDHSG